MIFIAPSSPTFPSLKRMGFSLNAALSAFGVSEVRSGTSAATYFASASPRSEPTIGSEIHSF